MTDLFAPPVTPSEGNFDSHGSWHPDASRDGSRDPIASLYWFIDMLVTRRRRTPDAPPALFAARIRVSRFAQAFPNLDQWESLSLPAWAQAWTASSAEETVKRCGYGPIGHWHANLWVQGAESDCSDPRHRPDHSRTSHSVVNAIIDALPDPRSGEPNAAPAPSSPRMTDEQWFTARHQQTSAKPPRDAVAHADDFPDPDLGA